jgi:predicted RNA-binding protein with PUA-like domain
VYFRVAPAVWGPWSEPALLFRTQAGWHGVRNYGARVHGEMAQDGGRVEFVSYARATGLNAQSVEMERVEFGAGLGGR